MNLALAALLAAGGWAGHTPVHGAPSPSRWVLVYAGGPSRPAYPVDDLVHLLAVVDSTDRPIGWLCDGVILTEFQAVSGRFYMPRPNVVPATGADWELYLDSVFAKQGPLYRIDKTVDSLDRALKTSGRRLAVAITIPYPNPLADTIHFLGVSYDQKSDLGRVASVSAYMREAVRRFRALSLRNLDLKAFYWVYEGIPDVDREVVSKTSEVVHDLGFLFLWIPSWRAHNALNWKALGFDDAWLQPNYFFHPDIPLNRMDSAATMSVAAGMGIELELDRRMFGDSLFANRLGPYLELFERHPDLRSRSIAIYEGAGALIRLARSRDAEHRAVYERLVKAMGMVAAR